VEMVKTKISSNISPLFVPRFVADFLLISAGIGSSFVLLSCSLAMLAMLP